MAFDTQQERWSCVGINFMPGFSVYPDADHNIQWRQAAGYGFAGSLTSAFEEQRGNIILGLNAATTVTTGWNDEVRDGGVLAPQHVERTSNNVVTITLPPIPLYNIASTETITSTAPASALDGASEIVGSPTFDITAVGGIGADEKMAAMQQFPTEIKLPLPVAVPY